MSSQILQRLSNPNYLDICRAVTKGAELANDLYSELIIMFHDKPPREDIPESELKRLFFEFAKRTWFLPKSQFNKKYKRFQEQNQIKEEVYSIPLEEDVCDIKQKNSTFVQCELKRKPENDFEMFVIEVAKIHFEGHSITEIAEITGLDRSAIRKSIIQFEENVRNHYNRCRVGAITSDTTTCSTT